MCTCRLTEIGWDRIFFGMNWYEKIRIKIKNKKGGG